MKLINWWKDYQKRSKLKKLKKLLSQSIKEQAYHESARLREAIREVERRFGR